MEEDSKRAVILGGLREVPNSLEPRFCCFSFALLILEGCGMVRQTFFG